ncbi:MAG: PEP/pyruvate-binding domain-containing protein, partial [Prochlorothrix sp.]
AIQQVRASYDRPAAQQYRRDRVPADPTLANKPQADRPQRDSRRDSRQGEGRSSGSNNGGMSVIIQQQISGQLSGVAFSRDPLEPGDAVVIEALPGGADAVVSGQVTPESFRILLQSPENSEKSNKAENSEDMDHARDCSHSQATAQSINAFDRDNPQTWTPILEAVAQLARDLEQRYHGIPQDMEWTYDGKQLWILQTRPITTLQPLWTRKIAAEVIPGAIRPLTWSLNRPLTCGVWCEIFTIVLGDRAQGLDFQDTATLHNSHAYFNATLLGDIFRRMGLPAESLEFLTLGAKFSRPPIASTLGNIPGLLRLLGRIWTLERDFQCDYGQNFEPALDRWLSDEFQTHLRTSSPAQISQHLAEVRALLPRATYYQILAPLGFALGRAILRSEDEDLDQSVLPEVAALRSLQTLATQIRSHFIDRGLDPATLTLSPSESLQTQLEQTPSGSWLWQQLQGCIQQYGYLSDVGTDIAIANWHDDPTPALALVCQFIQNPPPTPQSSPKAPHSWLQTRLTLKGKVAQVYLQLLAEMRRSLLLLADRWVATGLLSQGEDLFFLTWSELDTHLGQAASSPDPVTPHRSAPPIAQRRHQWHQSSQDPVPFLVYGSTAAVPSAPRATAAVFDSASVPTSASATAAPSSQPLQGIGASRGQAEGVIRVVQNLQTWPEIDRNTILVVPYTDAGWAPLLAQAAGVIAETGGRLSHGAIVAREYGIPAVMGIERATTRLQTGQRVRLDGYQGTVTLL